MWCLNGQARMNTTQSCDAPPHASQSGRRDSNPRRPAWEASTLPLSYSRNGLLSRCRRRCLNGNRDACTLMNRLAFTRHRIRCRRLFCNALPMPTITLRFGGGAALSCGRCRVAGTSRVSWFQQVSGIVLTPQKKVLCCRHEPTAAQEQDFGESGAAAVATAPVERGWRPGGHRSL